MSETVRAHVALGANIGDPRRRVRETMRILDTLPRTRVAACSALYVTPPWGGIEQPDFINAAVCLDTGLPPPDLLVALQHLEVQAGRRRGLRNGPRSLDLDLLLYGDGCWHDDDLDIPHPRLHERAFVLLPLADIAADVMVPGRGRVAELLARVDTRGCRRLETVPVS